MRLLCLKLGQNFEGFEGFTPAPSPPWIGVAVVEEGVGTVVFVTSAVIDIINYKI